MAHTIYNLIRTQWPKRHSANERVRREARNLISVHIDLLRRLG